MLDSYKVLEFPRILNSIAGSCRTEIAKKKVLQLEMYDNLADLNEEQNRLEEAMTIHRIMGTYLLRHFMISVHILQKRRWMVF